MVAIYTLTCILLLSISLQINAVRFRGKPITQLKPTSPSIQTALKNDQLLTSTSKISLASIATYSLFTYNTMIASYYSSGILFSYLFAKSLNILMKYISKAKQQPQLQSFSEYSACQAFVATSLVQYLKLKNTSNFQVLIFITVLYSLYTSRVKIISKRQTLAETITGTLLGIFIGVCTVQQENRVLPWLDSNVNALSKQLLRVFVAFAWFALIGYRKFIAVMRLYTRSGDKYMVIQQD